MINLKTVLYFIGIFVSIIGTAMFIPGILELVLKGTDSAIFLELGCMCLIIGIALTLAFKTDKLKVTTRDTFLLTAFSWIVLCFFFSSSFLVFRIFN